MLPGQSSVGRLRCAPERSLLTHAHLCGCMDQVVLLAWLLLNCRQDTLTRVVLRPGGHEAPCPGPFPSRKQGQRLPPNPHGDGSIFSATSCRLHASKERLKFSIWHGGRRNAGGWSTVIRSYTRSLNWSVCIA